jgi:hypothetical protein
MIDDRPLEKDEYWAWFDDERDDGHIVCSKEMTRLLNVRVKVTVVEPTPKEEAHEQRD